MNPPPSNPFSYAQDSSTAITDGQSTSTTRSTRSQQQQPTWQGLPSRPSSRRDLFSSSNLPNLHIRSDGVLENNSRGVLASTAAITSPAAPTPQAVNRQVTSRQSSTSSTASLHGGYRTRAVTGTSSPRQGSSVSGLPSLSQAIATAAAPNNSPISASRFVRHSPSVSSSTVGSPVSGGGQLTSLVITQLNILLSTLKLNNIDAQAEKIHKLIDDNGMEVSNTYFRRLLQSSASTIFPNVTRTASSTDSASAHQILSQELRKLTTEVQQADKIAAALDTNEPDLFHDFDLAAFVDHFRLDPIAKFALIVSCHLAVKSDLRTKAEAILSNNFQALLSAIANPQSQSPDNVLDDMSPAVLASIVEKLTQEPPRVWSEEHRESLKYAIRVRYRNLNTRMPRALESALYLNELLESQDSRLVRTLQRAGPRVTSSLEACKEVLAGVETREVSYLQIANALLFMVIVQDGTAFNPALFVEAVRQHRAGTKIDWTDVVQGFDKENLRITKKQFLRLYHALLPLAKEYANFDIQSLWGGQWQYAETQLSFVVAFLSTTRDELDVTQIPNLRQAFSLTDYENAAENVKAFAAEAVKHPLVSRDATETLFTMIFRSSEAYSVAQMLGIPETLINPNMTIFVVAASAVPKPWQALQDQALKQLFYPFLLKQHENYDFVMHSLWLHDKNWVATRMVDFYQQDSMLLASIYEHAVEHGWLDLLLLLNSTFVVDLATYAHGKGTCDLMKWAEPNVNSMGVPNFTRAMMDFVRAKYEDELAFQRAESDARPPRSTVPLELKTVHALLELIGGYFGDEGLGILLRQCLQTYPRLFNYGEDEGRDALIEANCAGSHALPEEAGQRMEERYKSMYSGSTSPDQVVAELKRLKVSDSTSDQDLFAAMLQGLFDEYNCFGEYPNEALATTAVLFGGLLQFNVISGIAEQAALCMIFEAVSQHGPDDPMYRFGLQAMIHILARLKEWPHFAEKILHIPSLRGTQVVPVAEAIMRELQEEATPDEGDPPNGLTNGALDDELTTDAHNAPFSSVHVDPPLHPDVYEEPNEDVSDKVMFVLNNVSKRNLQEKFKDLELALEEKHHQWFAHYLVEELAKSQPNFQTLYLQLLETFGQKILWAEVLRETYASCAKMLNAQSTMESTNERTNLKNLAGWLGSLTLARNRPILHRNISFKDLLIEGHDTQRLLVAIPFTCKTLVHAAQSRVFQPPNPWIMELLGLLSELYHFFELKLNLKFEIEVMCKDLKLDIKDIEPLDIIRSRPVGHENSMLQQYIPDGTVDGFGDMHIMGLSKRASNERFSPEAVIQALPDLSNMLQIPQAVGSVTQSQLRNIFVSAAQQAIYEIIAPVVERSVTIAAISTAELIQKDFAVEADIEKLRSSAHTVVKALSGSLALVTCKEPLRMSIMNNIRILAARSLPDQLPEGQIIMFVNDNIETVCSLVERAAEEHSLAEIDAQLGQAINERRQHNERRPNECFNNPPVNRWARLIPEPFRQDPDGVNANGLNRQQLALYEDFGRQARAPSHAPNVSMDVRGQLPQDVLSDSFLPSIPTSAEAPALPPQGQQHQRMQIMQPGPPHSNGYVDVHRVGQRTLELIQELQQAARDAPETHVNEILGNTPIRRIYDSIVGLVEVTMPHDDLAGAAGQKCFDIIYHEAHERLEVEVFVKLLSHLCKLSPPTGRTFTIYLASADEEKLSNAIATTALLSEGLLEIQRIDLQVAQALKARHLSVFTFLGELLDEVLLGENPIALRSDFALTFEALSQLLVEEPRLESAEDLLSKLRLPISQQNGIPSPPRSDKQDQLEYIFEEWIHLQRDDTTERAFLAFVGQLDTGSILKDSENALAFYRTCMDMSCTFFDQTTHAPYPPMKDEAYLRVDAFAKLVAFIVLYQGPHNSDGPIAKAKSMDSILRFIVLLMNEDHNRLRERAHVKVHFRFFSSLLCELHAGRAMLGPQEGEVYTVYALALQTMQPRYFPAFTYQWLALISHRLLVPVFLNGMGRTSGGWKVYSQLLEMVLLNLTDIMATPEIGHIAQQFYQGVMRFFLMLHHDFPEFLLEHHMELNSSIPPSCGQLHNVVNSAAPRNIANEQPDPFTQGLKINRLDQVRQAPIVQIDLVKLLQRAEIFEAVDSVCHGGETSEDLFDQVLSALARAPQGYGQAYLANGLVLYVGVQATSTSSVFSSAAAPARLLEHILSKELPELRYQVISAMVNQVRYINAHTHYFSTALQHLFGTGPTELQQQIMRVLVERLLVSRPHPWGLIVTILEMVKSTQYDIWAFAWMDDMPQVKSMLMNIAQNTDRLPRSPISGTGI